MNWTDEGIILSVRPHGETSAIVELLTPHYGRHLGLVRGGRARRNRPILQMGNVVAVEWNARLADHLGAYKIELLHGHAARIMESAPALTGLNTICTLAHLLPEREHHQGLYEALRLVLDYMCDDDDHALWPSLLVRWEQELLQCLGFGLDLSCCAGTGSTQQLIYVSPRTGRAVSAQAGAPYRDKLLTLPQFLLDEERRMTDKIDIAAGLALTGHFLQKWVYTPRELPLPEVRQRLEAALQKREKAADMVPATEVSAAALYSAPHDSAPHAARAPRQNADPLTDPHKTPAKPNRPEPALLSVASS